MPNCFLGIIRHQGFELAFGPFMVEKRIARAPKQRRELRPRIRLSFHIDDADGVDSRLAAARH
jgi:hypothetical protein